MMDTVDLLETIGQNAQLKTASNDELGLAFARLNIDSAISSVVLNGDQYQLEKLLGANSNVCCVQQKGDDDEGEEQPDEVPADDDTRAMAVGF